MPSYLGLLRLHDPRLRGERPLTRDVHFDCELMSLVAKLSAHPLPVRSLQQHRRDP